MVLQLKNRQDEFLYFLGYVSRNRKSYLEKAIEYYREFGIDLLETDNVFEVCPFNDSLKQVIKAFHIDENGKKTNLHYKIVSMIGEFIFLVSDYAPECCADGRVFYCKTNKRSVCMECDRCGKIYDLEGKIAHVKPNNKMTKSDFVNFFGGKGFADWPYHQRLKLPK